MMRIALIGCGKAKASEACRARDLYTGSLFRAALGYAEGCFDHVYIVSALHELVGLEDELGPYNRKLSDLPAKYQAIWGERVAKRLVGRHTIEIDVTILAGKDYVEAIRSGLLWCRIPDSAIHAPLAGLGMGQRLAWFNAQKGADCVQEGGAR